MSSLNRIISGTSSGISRNFFALIVTILSLPIYLSFWTLDQYGAWILILVIISILNIPISSYQEYLGNEFLKLGKRNKIEISKILYGSTIIIFIYSVLLIFLIFFLLNFTNLLYFIKINQSLIDEASIAMIIIYLSYIIGFICGLFTRALYPFYYYAKLNWIGLIIQIVLPVCQIFFVTLGFELVELSIVTFFTLNFLQIIYFIYILKLIKKEKLTYIKFYFLNNLNHLKNSIYLIIGSLAKIFKNEGVRLILAPFLGTTQMISYVTMNTANNFMRQIFSSFTNSLLIEFIDYINNNNKDKFLYTHTILYFIFCLIITPFAFFFQMIIPIIFEIWTRDKILFDPILFASLTSSFLIMIFYNPASIILRGKNLFKEDLVISIFTSIIFILLLIFLLDTYSIKGAGYSILIIEIFSCLFFFYFANKWLKKNFISFKKEILFLSIIDLTVTVTFIFLYLLLNYFSGYIISIYMIIKFIVIFIFWNGLSEFEQKETIRIFNLLINFRKRL